MKLFIIILKYIYYRFINKKKIFYKLLYAQILHKNMRGLPVKTYRNDLSELCKLFEEFKKEEIINGSKESK